MYRSCNIYYSSLPNIKSKCITAVSSSIFYEILNMYINNTDYMPIYNINVLLEVMNMILSICMPMDQSLK